MATLGHNHSHGAPAAGAGHGHSHGAQDDIEDGAHTHSHSHGNVGNTPVLVLENYLMHLSLEATYVISAVVTALYLFREP